MELTTAPRPAALSIPPPPVARAGRRQPASVLDALLSPATMPSVLDVDPARLAAASAVHARPPQPPNGRAPAPPPDDENADRRVERLRVLVTGGAAAAIALVSAGALHLAL